MQVVRTAIPDVLVLQPRVFHDERGFFLESFNARTFRQATALDCEFVQDNHSRSQRGTLRGLHYQLEHAQGKLVRVGSGRVFDVVVDLRRSSATFGKAACIELDAQNHRQVWIPAGCAHGFLVLSETADFLYKTTDYYHPASERTLRWSDPALGIQWPLHELRGGPLLSPKDQRAPLLDQCEVFD